MKIAILVLASVAMASALNINAAPVQALADSLPGVGPAMAKRIDSARSAAPLRSCADLDKIKGIGEKKLAKICPKVEF